jgi:hypothetical protein
MLPERPKRVSIGCRLAQGAAESVVSRSSPHILDPGSRTQASHRHCRCLSLPGPPLLMMGSSSQAQTRTDRTKAGRRSRDDTVALGTC